ncbi:hypothetical protein ABIC60_002658 [Phyllobacterium ifriqiyense]
MTDDDHKPYLSSVWPYLLIVAVVSVISIAVGRSCSETHEHGYRVPAHNDPKHPIQGNQSSPLMSGINFTLFLLR